MLDDQLAVAAPTPGSACRSASVAVLRLIGAQAAERAWAFCRFFPEPRWLLWPAGAASHGIEEGGEKGGVVGGPRTYVEQEGPCWGEGRGGEGEVERSSVGIQGREGVGEAVWLDARRAQRDGSASGGNGERQDAPAPRRAVARQRFGDDGLEGTINRCPVAGVSHRGRGASASRGRGCRRRLEPLDGSAAALLERHDRLVAEQLSRACDVGLRVADVAGARPGA